MTQEQLDALIAEKLRDGWLPIPGKNGVYRVVGKTVELSMFAVLAPDLVETLPFEAPEVKP